MLDQRGKEFVKLLESLKPSKHSYEVFSDWLVMASATLYAWKKDEGVEKQYADIANQYTKDEIDKHAHLLAITIDALDETDKLRERDFLGEVFTFGNFTNDRNGQFFTPYNISRMMADMIIGEREFPEHRNSCLVEGRIGDNPVYDEKEYVCQFTLLSGHIFENGEEEITPVTVWARNKLGETIKNTGKQGRGVRVVGRLRLEDTIGLIIEAEHIELRPEFKPNNQPEEDK